MQASQDTWWFRLLKTIWIIGFVLALVLVVVFASFYAKDSTSINKERSYFICDNGTRIDFDEINSSNIYSSYLSDTEKRTIKKMCIQNDQTLSLTPPTDAGIDRLIPNFKMHLVEQPASNIGAMLGYTAIAILSVIFIFELVKRIFYYIVFGKLVI